jgi:hypothetical protein
MRTTPNPAYKKGTPGNRTLWALLAVLAVLIVLGFLGVGAHSGVNSSLGQALQAPTQTTP